MSNMLPVAVYGLKVPAGDVMIPAVVDFPATFRITMAAIDPSATPEHTGTTNGDAPARATLKVVYDPSGPGDEEESGDSDDEDDMLRKLLAGGDSDDDDNDEDDDDDDESSSDDEERNGGPSDPSKTRKARKEAAVQEMMKALAEQNDSEDEMDVDNLPGVNGVAKKVDKGKGKATDEDLGEEDSEDESDVSMDGMEELVICTLDPEKNYQQPLDITIPEDQRAYFKVSGTHAIYLTGNYVIPADSGRDHQHGLYGGEDDDDEYDMSPDEDELEDDEESDELDDLEDPRITEIATDEEDIPKLVKKAEPLQKGKNKRAHEESPENEAPASLDDIMAKSLKPAEPATNGTTNGEPKLSKKQLKKLKNNAGKAVEAAAQNKDANKLDSVAGAKDSPAKGDKKVQFAQNLEQGPAKSELDKSKIDARKEDGKPKASLGVKTVQGVTIDDRKLGSGPAAKKGNKVGMRYIGKLKDGKVFDANKKGKPFSFTIGDGSVIKGWDIAVAGMQVGGERRVRIPADLAYGKKGTAGIPGNSELIFELKLLEIN